MTPAGQKAEVRCHLPGDTRAKTLYVVERRHGLGDWRPLYASSKIGSARSWRTGRTRQYNSDLTRRNTRITSWVRFAVRVEPLAWIGETAQAEMSA